MNPSLRSTGRGNHLAKLSRALNPIATVIRALNPIATVIRALNPIATVIILGVLGVGCGTEGSSSNGDGNREPTSSAQQEAGFMMEGTVKIEDLDDLITISAITVRLQDVGRAGAAAKNVAEVTIEDAIFAPGDGTGFSLAVPAGLDPTGSYILAAHADLDGSGDISVGDYITMASNPVVVDGSQRPVELLLRLVTS